ncbi:MAG TPA: PKD domain-containing protein, partial [Deltaproteobacteria bacterium]|nr:PKD domain-containing protein [Deltaproteobacteria bacterium]
MRILWFFNILRPVLALMLVTLLFGCGGSGGGGGNGGEPLELIVAIDSPAGDASISEGEAVDFQSTVSGGSAPYVFEWTFGDGSAGSTDEDPGSITFPQSGTYTCTLSVTDADGTTANISVVVNVAEVAVDLIPTATITDPSANISINAGNTVNFRGSATSGDSPLTYAWSFPGGTPGSSTS